MTTKTSSEQFYDLADQYVKDERYEEAIQLYKKLIEMNPADDSLVLSLAWAYRDSGQLEEAIQCFEKLLDKELARKVFTGFAFDELVRIYQDQGDHARLVELCERVVAVQPDDIHLLMTLGDSCIRAGFAQRAIEIFTMLTEIDPESSVYFCKLGNACILAEDFEKAENAYEAAVGCEDGEAHSFYNRLGYAYGEAGFYERAERALKKAIECKGDQPFYYCNLGDIYIRQGKIKDAGEAYEQAIKIHPESTGHFYNRLGNLLANQGYLKNAIDCYEKAVAADPDNPFYQVSLAESYNQEGRHAEAGKVLEKLKGLKKH